MLLDEPSAGLDGAALERVTALLNGLGVTLLICSQDHACLDRVAQRTLLLNAGLLAETESPRWPASPGGADPRESS